MEKDIEGRAYFIDFGDLIKVVTIKLVDNVFLINLEEWTDNLDVKTVLLQIGSETLVDFIKRSIVLTSIDSQELLDNMDRITVLDVIIREEDNILIIK